MIPTQIRDQVSDKCTEGLVLALACDDDGAIMELKWCNKAFTKITGYAQAEVIGQRGTILIGHEMEQGKHLHIIEKLMNWEQFTVKVQNNGKDGGLYWQQMTWVPLSNADNGSRWWLCSIVRLMDEPRAVPSQDPTKVKAPSIELIQELNQQIQSLEKENTQLHALARSATRESNEDALTGLSNRRHFEVEFRSWVAAMKDGGPSFAVIYIDVDRFKTVNDTLGHDAGDSLLNSVAETLRDLTDETDLVARIGGDEFVILKPLGDSALNISGLADEIVQRTQIPFGFEDKTVTVSASVGVAITDAKMDNPEQVVADADTALYHAKTHGKGRWSFFTEEMHANLIATKRLSSDLLLACERGEFVPFFQPVIDVATGKISSAEVLVRWAHPVRGLLAPVEFLDAAADIGVLRRIDEIVFSKLCDALADLDQSGFSIPSVAVNTSAERLTDSLLIHDIQRSGIDPGRLTIEILESVFIERMTDAFRWTLDQLDELGVTIAIDDFGTGHASIQGLLQIKPSILKIDRQFVQPAVEDKTSEALVGSIISIGTSLGMRIVAEGIETEEHALVLNAMGCDYLQGYHFGKPMRAEELCVLLKENKGQFWKPQKPESLAYTRT